MSDARDPGRAQHRLELRGAALPPWVIDRLAAVLAVTQDGNFCMACDTHPLTLALNWCPTSSSSGSAAGAAAAAAGAAEGNGGRSRRSSKRQVLGSCVDGDAQAELAAAAAAPAVMQQKQQQLTDYEARQRGCWDSEEAARWRAVVPGLSCNVLRELRCEGGQFVGKLSAKSAERVVL